jgi:hypothetical protein
MMMSNVIMIMTADITAVSAAFRLERGLHLHKLRSKAMEHLLDHMVGPNAQSLIANFCRHMPISQMPGKTHELIGVLVPDFDKSLHSGLDPQQPPVVKLQGISIRHCNRSPKIEKDIFAVISSQANSAAVTRIEIKRERTCRFFLRPMSRWAMNGSVTHCHIST